MVQSSFPQNAKINVGKTFFKLLTKKCRKNHKHHKIFNKSNMKVNCSCTDNMKKITTTRTLLPIKIKQIKIFTTVETMTTTRLKINA